MKNKFFIFILPIFFAGILSVVPSSCAPARDGGVWRSQDNSETWQQRVFISENQDIARTNILTFAFDPRDSKIIYAGVNGGGIYKSMDGGDVWYHLDDPNEVLDKRANVYDIAIDPRNPNIIYAGVYQDRLGRLLRSGDAGKSWQEVYRASREQYAVFAVEIDSFDPSVVYMGTAEGGFLKSADFGRTWRVIRWFDDVINDIKVNPHNTRAVFVVTRTQGVFKTDDKGDSWRQLENLRDFPVETSEMKVLVMDKNNPDVLYLGSQSGLLKSVDAGQTWQRVNIVIPPNSVPVSAIALDPRTSFYLYYAAGNVVYRTQDNGQTWMVNPIPSAHGINAFAIDPQNPEIIYAGMGE